MRVAWPGAEARRRILAALGESAWLVGMVALPVAVWHRVLDDTLSSFRPSPSYVISDLSPWLLLLAGIAFLVPVAVSAGLHPESHLYPRARRVYATWGIVLYLLGLILLVEVAQLWSYAH